MLLQNPATSTYTISEDFHVGMLRLKKRSCVQRSVVHGFQRAATDLDVIAFVMKDVLDVQR